MYICYQSSHNIFLKTGPGFLLFFNHMSREDSLSVFIEAEKLEVTLKNQYNILFRR